ncbi:conserved hypothetical protein [Mesorhizobium plurifarium]|uniref:HTH cro/C1-type domain-containing protein n=1 Tax=Mesorhizobium plurifarium TaxID=69974 RepID=A0A0K2W4K6_MESPL|nr:conserved hypothetical protein [Mesorhizobium plurifarium]
MSFGVPNFRGERLREARLARGMFKNTLGDLIGVSGSAISRYEDGLDKPQAHRVSVIAEKLQFPQSFFFTPAWGEEIGLVHWRSRASESKSAREITEQRIRWLCEIFGFLQSDVDFPKLNLPELDIPKDFNLITNGQIEQAATDLRSYWKLRTEPIPDMILALENAGIPVTTLKIPSDKQDGLCFTSNLLQRPFVIINVEGVSCSRARFDAAHELGHLVLHRNVTPDQARMPAAHKLIEQQAHRFAGAMLFPRESFIAEVGSVSLDYFCALKRRWGISISAMIMRAYDLGLTDEDGKAQLFRSMTVRRWRGPLREPYDSPKDMPLERPRMLRRGFEVMLASGGFAKSTVKSAIPLPDQELEQLSSLDEGTFADGKLDQTALARLKPAAEMLDLESGNVLLFRRRFR